MASVKQMEAEVTLYALYIPEGLLTNSSNKSGRNNKGAATKPCCLNKFPTRTGKTQNRVASYRYGEGRARSDPEVSKKREKIVLS